MLGQMHNWQLINIARNHHNFPGVMILEACKLLLERTGVRAYEVFPDKKDEVKKNHLENLTSELARSIQILYTDPALASIFEEAKAVIAGAEPSARLKTTAPVPEKPPEYVDISPKPQVFIPGPPKILYTRKGK